LEPNLVSAGPHRTDTKEKDISHKVRTQEIDGQKRINCNLKSSVFVAEEGTGVEGI